MKQWMFDYGWTFSYTYSQGTDENNIYREFYTVKVYDPAFDIGMDTKLILNTRADDDERIYKATCELCLKMKDAVDRKTGRYDMLMQSDIKWAYITGKKLTKEQYEYYIEYKARRKKEKEE